MRSGSRIAWVDGARAVGILAIVFSHAVYGEGAAAQACYAFHVPLFCFCAGWVFHGEKTPFPAFVWKRVLTTLLPWALFCLISIALYAVGAGRVMSVLGEVKDPSPLHALRDMLKGYCYANSPLWFLPCFFLQQLLLRLLTGLPFCRRKPVSCLAAAAALSAAASWLYLSRPHAQIPWAADTAVILLPFACLGALLRRLPEPKLRGLPRAAVGAALTAGGLLLSVFVNTKVNYWDNEYGQPLLFYAIAILTVYGLMLLLSAPPSLPGAVLRVGQGSLGILLMHKFPILFFQVFVPFASGAMRAAAFGPSLAVSAVCVAMCCAVMIPLRRWAPWAIGERRNPRPSP